MQKEARARIKINKLLENSGWRLIDDENGKANVLLESGLKIEDVGEDYEKIKKGFADFLLLDGNNFPIAVLEAKSEAHSPLDGKEQARRYALSSNVRFVILSNGNMHYLWDIESGNPEVIITFPTLQSFQQRNNFKPDTKALINEQVNSDYVVLTQNTNYKKDPQWINENEREKFISVSNLCFLRPYQVQAVESLKEGVKNHKTRFLFEMATGTGKTLVSAAIIKLFLRTGNARRILFLVDRLELEDQAEKAFKQYLKNDYTAVIFKENREEWNKAEIVISTVQTLLSNNNYQSIFSPTDFDLVISDEAHRSISGNSRAVFEYFIGYKLGLTATPKDYLKKLKNEDDPRELERRQLLDTYRTFGCESGEPTFRYTLLDGVRDKYLVNPTVVDARTEITTQLLSDKGYATLVENEEGVLEEQIFYHKDFERKFFSQKTNEIFVSTFLEHALKDPLTGEVGKTIMFCVSQNHASKITQLLNIFADKLYPGKYNSDFAVQITSKITDSQGMTVNFTNNNLNGHSRFLEGYTTSKTRVCVTVGMMTTGYDCQDILNVCLLRPIFSPTDFVQIKGRGTRLYTFRHKTREGSFVEEEEKKKNTFKLFDFFANCEYFEEKFNYDEILKLPPTGGTSGPGGEGPEIDPTTIAIPDPLKNIIETQIGPQGMKVDRKLFEKFEDEIKNDPDLTKSYKEGDMQKAQEILQEKHLNKPEEFVTLEKLRRALHLDRRLKIEELLDKIFGKITGFKSKDELLEEEFNKFVSTEKPKPEEVMLLKQFFKAYLSDIDIRQKIDEKDYQSLATNPKLNLRDLRQINVKWREYIPEYVKDYIPLNAFV